MESFFRDLKQSFRMFRRNPTFTFTVIAVLALGIGTNTAIFSVISAVLLKPVRAPQPDRVVMFTATNPAGSSSIASELDFNLWRQQTQLFQDVSGYYLGAANLTHIDQPRHLNAIHVTKDYFHLFGLSIAQGRAFSEEEERPKGPDAVILSEPLWKNTFGGDRHVIGKTVSLGGTSYQVVGVMARNIQTETPETPDLWLPFPIDPRSSFQGHYFETVGRLKTGVTFPQANAQLQLITQEFRRKYPNAIATHRGDVYSVQPLRQVLVKDAQRSLLILAGAVGLVLLIACANIANLLLIRASVRTREMAIRIAVGASRKRIIRQLLTESLLLSFTGAVIGSLLGIAGVHALLTVNAAHLPRIGIDGANVTADWRVCLFTALLSLLTVLLFGLLPALQASRVSLNSTLNDNNGRTGVGFRQKHLRSLFVVGEMSFALPLLIGAGLLMRTLIALHSVDPGFDPHNVVTTQTPLDPKAAQKSGVSQIVRDATERVRALPGVEDMGYTRLLPLGGGFDSIPVVIAGRPLNGPAHAESRWMVVSTNYFNLLKIPMLRGRSFADTDRLGTPGVAVINETMARQLWPNGDALNARIFVGKGLGPKFDEPARQIVGIVADVHDNALGEPPQPAMFTPGEQLSEARRTGVSVSWMIRTHASSQGLNAAIMSELRHATGEPTSPLRSMDEVIWKSTARQNLNLLLMTIFAAIALLLSAVGIYGLMAYSVQQRQQEIGIRIALGAQPADVRNMVVVEGLRLILIGIIVGAAAAIALTRFLNSFLFGVETLDPLTFTLVPALFAVAALAATWLPAQRASQVDPITALRQN